MKRFIDPFTSVWFIEGLKWGIIALIVGLVIALVLRRTGSRSAPLVGVLIAMATLASMPVVREIPDGLWQGVALLAVGGAPFPWARRIPVLPALLAMPGAWLITEHGELPVEGWRVVLLFELIVLGAPLAASFDRHHALRGSGPVLATVALLGAFTTLPDTEEILVLLGVALPLTLLAWPIPLARLGGFGVYPAIGVFAWVIAWGGRGRDTAIIGAVAGLGLLVVEPVVRWIRQTTLLDLVPEGPLGPVLVGVGQLIVVGVTARVAGLRTGITAAALIAVAALVIAGLIISSTPQSRGRHGMK